MPKDDRKFWISLNEEFINGLNLERFELAKTGKIKLIYPEGAHDDHFWAVALVYTTTVGRQSVSRFLAVSF